MKIEVLMFEIEPFVLNKFEDYSYYGNPATDIRVDCPFCYGRGAGYDEGQHLHISIDKQTVHCFRCSYAAGWIRFVMDTTGLPYWKALGELYHPARVRGDIKEAVEKHWQPSNNRAVIKEYGLPGDFQLLAHPDTNDTLYRRVRKYVESRGFDRRQYTYYSLGYAHSIGHRVIIPIEDGYWQGRALTKWITPKYMNPDAPARGVLFNARALEDFPEVVICEGAFSAMAVGYNAVALISKEATAEKMERLIRSSVEHFIIALEPGAYSSMSKVAERLYKNERKVTLWRYSIGDPADPDGRFEVVEYGLKSKLMFSLGG